MFQNSSGCEPKGCRSPRSARCSECPGGLFTRSPLASDARLEVPDDSRCSFRMPSWVVLLLNLGIRYHRPAAVARHLVAAANQHQAIGPVLNHAVATQAGPAGDLLVLQQLGAHGVVCCHAPSFSVMSLPSGPTQVR